MRTLSSFYAVLLACTAMGQTLTDSLVAHFPLDGNGLDTVGGLVPITIQGTPFDTTDRFGNSGGALWFDGASFFSYGDVLDMDTSDFSISVWCLVDAVTPGTQDHDYVVANGTTIFGTPSYSGYSLGVREVAPDPLSARGAIGEDQSGLFGAQGFATYGTWHHLVLNRCGTLLEFHVDQVLVGQDSLPANASVGNNIVFTIGAQDRYPTNQPDVGFFKGAIDDIRIYRGRCLSAGEIQQMASPVGSEQVGALGNVGLWPNPGSGIFTIRLPDRVSPTPFHVINSTGQVVRTVQLGGGLQVVELRLPSGIYFLRNSEGAGYYTQVLVIQ